MIFATGLKSLKRILVLGGYMIVFSLTAYGAETGTTSAKTDSGRGEQDKCVTATQTRHPAKRHLLAKALAEAASHPDWRWDSEDN